MASRVVCVRAISKSLAGVNEITTLVGSDSDDNILSSFFPAFPGARSYHNAYQRGVKIVGATSHYITEELDSGPIIEQDVIRVNYNDSVNDLVRKGEGLEKQVLSKAIWSHINREILIYKNRTIMFNK